LYSLPRIKEFFFFASFSVVGDLGVLLMQNVPDDAILLFYLHAAILGWLPTAVKPKLQHPRHRYSEIEECSLRFWV
jgi:hypothetical protein